MNYGLNVSASGVMTSMYRQDVLSNNLANLLTPGFKPDTPMVKLRDPVRVEDGLMHLPSNVMLERLGAGTLLAPNRTSRQQGELEVTGNPLDAAIRGQGYFVMEADSGGGEKRVRLTRDGRFTLNSQGRLVGATTGLSVLDDAGRAIVIDRSAGSLAIGGDGAVMQNGRVVARIQVSTVPDPDSLRKMGDNLYEASASQADRLTPVEDAEVIGGSLERSGVDPVMAIMGVTNAGSAVANNARMLQMQDEMMGRAINTLGRVA